MVVGLTPRGSNQTHAMLLDPSCQPLTVPVNAQEHVRNWLICAPNCPACEPHATSTDSAIDAFQDFSRPTHFVTERAALETLPGGQFDVDAPCASLRDGLRPTLLRGSPSRARPRSGGRQAGPQPS